MPDPIEVPTTVMENEARLPLPLSSFIGRQTDIESLRQLLSAGARLITLTGPGGVGKTRLALEVTALSAADFADGVFFVPLQALTEPGQVLEEVASVLRVPESGTRPLIEDLCAALAGSHALICIDNWEHVLGAAPQLTDLLMACRRLHVVATSREALRLQGEHEYPVHALSIPIRDGQRPLDAVQAEAVQLFVARAQAVKPGFAVNESSALIVGEICTLLDGLPLAIELAAALLRLFSPQALLARLKSVPNLAGRSPTMQLLVGGPRDLPVRQQTLRAAIAWSYDLLDTREQRLFRRLAIFAGGCDLEAVEAVCSNKDTDLHPMLDLLITLVDKSLLQVQEIAGEPRFSMLRTIQEYALELLEHDRESSDTHHRHAMHYLAMVERTAPELKGANQAKWLEHFDREHDNVRAAIIWSLDHNQVDLAFRIAGELWRYWIIRGFNKEADRWFDRILAAKGDVSAHSRAKVLNGAGAVAWALGDLERSRRYHTECLAFRMEIGDAPGIAASYHNLAITAQNQSDIEAAVAYFRESVARYDDLGDQWGAADGLLQLGNIMRRRKAFEEARTQLERGLAMLRELGDKQGVAGAYYLLGELAEDEGKREQARQYFSESRLICIDLGYVWGIALASHELGRIALYEGDLQQAEACLFDGLRLKYELGEKLGIIYSLEVLACLAAAQRDMPKAAKLWGAAEALRVVLDAPLEDDARENHERYVRMARVQMRQEAFLIAKEAGAHMSLDEAVRYALEPSGAVTRSKTAHRSYPAGLTAREVEVLALVAQGLTDAEVAERLVLSTRTVHAHLTSIYNKLGVNSRVAATRLALEQKLV